MILIVIKRQRTPATGNRKFRVYGDGREQRGNINCASAVMAGWSPTPLFCRLESLRIRRGNESPSRFRIRRIRFFIVRGSSLTARFYSLEWMLPVRCWVHELRSRSGKRLTLGTVGWRNGIREDVASLAISNESFLIFVVLFVYQSSNVTFVSRVSFIWKFE